jgi:poly-gamma-glutamate capsule biosynthesis protein CapA/YwtB (metallophosphatase superfamily)
VSRRRRILAAALLATAAAVACSDDGPRLADAASTPPPTTDPVPTTADGTSVAPPTAAPTTTEAPRAVTIAFGGDVYGQPPVRTVLERGENPLAAVTPWLRDADVAVVNLETAVGSTGLPRDKQFVFQSDPALLDALTGAGVDVVSVANNHSFDHGLEGFLETLDHVARAGLRTAGGGRTAVEAYAPVVVPVGGREIAILGVAVIGPDDADRAQGDRPGTTNGRDMAATRAAIAAAKARTPAVIVVVHWGAELAACPRPYERDLARQMLDAGATAIVGAHPHVLQGVDASPGRFVAYSIGNFVFAGRSEATRRTGVLTLTVEPDGTVSQHRWDPARIDDAGRPIPLDGAARDAEVAAFAAQPADGPACA